jgi:hypothetical protein
VLLISREGVGFERRATPTGQQHIGRLTVEVFVQGQLAQSVPVGGIEIDGRVLGIVKHISTDKEPLRLGAVGKEHEVGAGHRLLLSLSFWEGGYLKGIEHA